MRAWTCGRITDGLGHPCAADQPGAAPCARLADLPDRTGLDGLAVLAGAERPAGTRAHQRAGTRLRASDAAAPGGDAGGDAPAAIHQCQPDQVSPRAGCDRLPVPAGAFPRLGGAGPAIPLPDRGRDRQAPVYHHRLCGLRAADPAGGDLEQPVDPQAGAAGLAPDPQAHLSRDPAGGRSLRLAGQRLSVGAVPVSGRDHRLAGGPIDPRAPARPRQSARRSRAQPLTRRRFPSLPVIPGRAG
eukprot:m.256964 g.256964  ORF g.256964 m.256964 type:complete len:243 (+) comp23072_c0_seq1:909-1637(+)